MIQPTKDFCGLSFDFSENLPSSISHLKESVKHHIRYTTHKTMSALKDKVSKEQEVLYNKSKDVAINCASAAYMSYKLGLLYAIYENLITEIHTSGGNIGQKNHSKEFSRNILGPMYEVLRNSIVSFVTDNKLPFGLLADEMTAKHRKRHNRYSCTNL